MKINKFFPKILKAVLVITVIPFVLLCFFSHPSSDDFCYGYRALQGFWNTQIYYYNNWSGRYFATAAASLYPYITDFLKGYKFATLFFLISFFLALLVFFKAIANNLVSNRELFWGTLLVFSIYLTRMSSPAESFYWLAGAVAYSYGTTLLLLLLSLLMFYGRLTFKKSINLSTEII